MLQLSKSLQAWGTETFKTVLKQEIEQLKVTDLPLQQGLAQSSYVSDEAFSAIILEVVAQNGKLVVKAGISYSGIQAGCSCADDPSPDNELPEYCELLFEIDNNTAETTVSLHCD